MTTLRIIGQLRKLYHEADKNAEQAREVAETDSAWNRATWLERATECDIAASHIHAAITKLNESQK